MDPLLSFDTRSPQCLPLSSPEVKSCGRETTITKCLLVFDPAFSCDLPLSSVGLQVVKLIELSREGFTVGGGEG